MIKYMKFSQLYKLLIESSDFSDLPKDPPYGFWVFPDGTFAIVPRMGHYRVARMIMDKSPEMLEALNISFLGDFYGTMREFGFIRIAKELDDKDIYNIEGKRSKISNDALKTAKDLCHFYNMEINNYII